MELSLSYSRDQIKIKIFSRSICGYNAVPNSRRDPVATDLRGQLLQRKYVSLQRG
jgi:hypothetical protein